LNVDAWAAVERSEAVYRVVGTDEIPSAYRLA
jgi:hypothetical protein